MSMQNNNNSSGYMSWWYMIDRCVNVNSKKYKNYGLRGIKVCDRWLGKEGFINFLEDMGPQPTTIITIQTSLHLIGQAKLTQILEIIDF